MEQLLKKININEVLDVAIKQLVPVHLQEYKEKVISTAKELIINGKNSECLQLFNEYFYSVSSSFLVSDDFYAYHKQLSDLTTIHQDEDELEDVENLIYVPDYTVDENGIESETGLDYEALSYPKHLRDEYYKKKKRKND